MLPPPGYLCGVSRQGCGPEAEGAHGEHTVLQSKDLSARSRAVP